MKNKESHLFVSRLLKVAGVMMLTVMLMGIIPDSVTAQQAQSAQGSGVNINIGGEVEDFSLAIQALILITVLSFGPAIVTMMTSFTRLVVVFFFLRMGLGTQQSPPNQVLLGLALFITIFIMASTFNRINDEAIQPYIGEEISQTEALTIASVPLKQFMVNQTREKDLLMFMDLGGIDPVASLEELPLYVVVPSYIISELRIAFQIGFLIYLPFMVIDLVVASILLSMGIMFLPPVLVSLPFKILVFVLSDGWYLLVESLIRSFN
ncbi:flagellar type III secretion system pore protein FliP [Rhodohalobacter mucosus]|uniref:Flagellar biosynthetic protein FliP n=1 Tax=Rhodohalobacter mucosus TaxID=2079485 RepID=A0A316TKW1_9BACT|nr:flagellar type III secretion system pore protein FliP [Rhodohalobacter mucosus]PWN05187.1 flagellar biosynthetic protein FliP [Rhodohalobacter mucosus]